MGSYWHIFYRLPDTYASLIDIYKESTEDAQQHYNSNGNFEWAVLGKIIDTLFNAAFWTAVATIAIACFTWTLKRSTDRLWDAARDQIAAAENAAKIQSTDMNASIAVAKEAADATKDAVKLASKTAEWQLRAYLLINPQTVPNLDSNDALSFEIIVQNNGETPAYKIGGWVNMAIARYPPIPLPPLTDKKEATLAKGRQFKMFINFEEPFTDEEKAGIRDGTRARFYVWGEVQYIDAFGVQRFNRFRFEFGGPDALRNRRMAICEIGNDEN